MGYHLLKQRRIVDADDEDLEAHEFECGDEVALDKPWRRGIRFKQPPSVPIPLVFEDEDFEDGAFRDYLSTPVPLVSTRLKAALLSVPVTNLEFYETSVSGSDRFPDFPGYWALNVVGMVAVADAAASVGQRAMGVMGADLFDKLVVKPDLASDLRMFRMAEQNSTLVVSDEVKQACESLGIDTIEFQPLESSS